MQRRLPIIVLAGSDAYPGAVPPGMRSEDMLDGYKGVHRLPGGRCLAGELVDRLKRSDWFEEPILVGPRHVYDGHVSCEVVDADGNLATVLSRTFEFIRSRFDLSSPIAISTCDILPTPEDVNRLLATCYYPYRDCMFWWQLVEAQPNELGASAWKQPYRMRPAIGEPTKNLYPGHLVILRPGALRLSLTNRILQLAYHYRTRDMHKRFFWMIARGLGRLIVEDLCDLVRLRVPLLTVSIPYRGLSAYRRLCRQQLTLTDFENHVAKTFLHRECRISLGRPVVFATTSLVSFAKDIDTKAELKEAAASAPCISA